VMPLSVRSDREETAGGRRKTKTGGAKQISLTRLQELLTIMN
jgi:hypothetical protein